MATTKATKQERQDALDQVKMYQSNDWELREETPEYFVLRKNTGTLGGHILVFILTWWFTFGIGNLIYWLANNKTKKIVK
jgi:hypothetical protein